ncbi:ABC transporter permease [Hufsiella ginkgonis]|uniref:FtsX-like permease family protein n=1 Tax=Hufsiella ginkgonis TaxID=2695274 RepID=A0A7K1XW67_9SPHI|nr:ABC transporter permease [Hufsiella ginkgonis]MXV15067.1 FtsX-like permease family protein [Hufsiella ginkgonis]
MLKNYFKIAIAVLRRRKFFTFISLFGISFTLTILMVLTAFIDKVGNSKYPDKNRDRSLYIVQLEERGEKNGYTSRGPSSYYFLNKYAGSLKTPVKVGISSMFNFSSAYVNDKKIAINFKYTNADYWDIAEYDFLEGKPFSKVQVDQAAKVAVISEDTRTAYFGANQHALGKYVEVDNIRYKVVGVVKNVPITMFTFYGDMYLPYTLSKEDYRSKALGGSYTAVLMAASASDVPKMAAEYATAVSKIKVESKDYDKLYSFADPYFTGFVRIVLGRGSDSGITTFYLGLFIFVVLFLMLPAINLVNVNITRIMERSSEIGVRKAFGASSKTLVYQFVVENIILTLLGGVIGIGFSLLAIAFVNASNVIPNLELTLNYLVLLYSLVVCLFFGLLSGVYPAWRMSRLNVVTALKAR